MCVCVCMCVSMYIQFSQRILEVFVSVRINTLNINKIYQKK